MYTLPSRAFASGSVPPRRGALHHIRHNVLLLLGIYNVPLHNGIIRYAREADWILDDTYVRVGDAAGLVAEGRHPQNREGAGANQHPDADRQLRIEPSTIRGAQGIQ